MKTIKLNKNKYDIIFHLSDSDLDGYGAQCLLKEFNDKYNFSKYIYYYNTKVSQKSTKIKEIKNEILKNKNKNILFLITDISLTIDESKKLNNFQKSNLNIKLDLQLIDHHISGMESSKLYHWYYLNTEFSAAKLTYLWLVNNYKNIKKYEKIAHLIDISDTYKERDRYFEKSKILSNIIYKELKYPDILIDYQRENYFYIIKKISKEIYKKNKTIKILKKYIDIQNNFLNKYIYNKYIINDNEITIDNKLIYYIYTIINNELDFENEIKTIDFEFNEKKIKLIIFYNFDMIHQELSKYILNSNNDIDISINITKSGYVSLRTIKENLNLNELSKEYFNGGGHQKAAGGLINNFKSYSYNETLSIMKKILKV